MREVPSYSRRFFKQVWDDTCGFMQRKLLMGLVMGIIVQVALWKFAPKPLGWGILLHVLLVFAESYLTVFIGSFIINFCRAPVLLDREAQQEITQLSSALETPSKAQVDYLRGLVEKLSDEGKAILKFALFHEEVSNQQLSTALPSWPAVEKGYRECLDLGLLKYRNDSPDPHSPVRWSWDVFWVPESFRAPLNRLIYDTDNS